MAYLLDLFTPETWSAFLESGATVTGFRERHQRLAGERVRPGDIFLCYLTRLSRWCGVLQAESEAYFDNSPMHDELDAFPVRCKVKPIVILEPESAILIRDEKVWKALTITKRYESGHRYWTGFFRASLNRLEEEDGSYLVELLKKQQSNPESYLLTDKDKRELAFRRKIRTLDREVEVEVPDNEVEEAIFGSNAAKPTLTSDSRESIQVQAKIAQIGAQMGFRIWVPRSDKARVLKHIPPGGMAEEFLDELPFNYDDTTIKTVEQIDVLWLKGRSMARAFEIEHTTAIYSGLLRMADLLALQPNMDIRLHIVAHEDRRERVLREIKRPVFSLLDRGPLYEQCSFLSYDSISSLAEMKHLFHMRDTIVDEYEEFAEV